MGALSKQPGSKPDEGEPEGEIGGWRVSHSGGSFSSPFSGIGVIRSPLTVVPLHRGEDDTGLSQFDQSLSSKESTLRGVQEKCFVRLELVRFGRPRLAVSDSLRGSENRDVGVGVTSLNVLLRRGRAGVADARIVSPSFSPSLILLEPLR